MTALAPHATEASGTDRRTSFVSRLGLILRSVWTVLEFEFKKSRTWKRMLIWLGVSMFPALIVFLMLFAGDWLPREGWVSIVFVMACEMVVILNAMLWVAPIVQTELEGKTWLYIVARPYGRICLVVGKLLNGLIWTLGAGLLALTFVGSVALLYARPIEGVPSRPPAVQELTARQAEAQRLMEELEKRAAKDPQMRRFLEQRVPGYKDYGPYRRPGTAYGIQYGAAPAETEPPFASIKDALGVGGILAMLSVLAGLTYSSLFCGIGCIIPKRAMLISFSYTLIFETIVAFVPAIINRLTIQYHLRCLLNRWVDLKVPLQGQELFFSNWPAWWHVAVLVGMIVVWQIVSLVVIHLRQYVLGDEN